MIYDVTIENLKFCYLKLKSHYFYNSNPLFMKEKIIGFEDNIDERLSKLVENFNNNSVDNYINSIRFAILPKKNKIAINNKEVIIKDFNYFIDCPIEIYLLDILWIFNILEYMDLNVYENLYGNRLNYYIRNNNDNTRLYNRNIFENYNKLYSSWKNDCFKVVEQENKENDLVILNLDIEKFYYSINFDFNDVYKILIDRQYEESIVSNKLNMFIKRVYCYYDTIVNDTKNIIHSRNNVSLPIGLISSAVISNYVLKEFDKKILSHSDVLYYGRYVDDMLLVFENDKIEKDIISYLNKKFFEEFQISENVCINNRLLQNIKTRLMINIAKSQKFIVRKGDFAHTKFKNLLKEKIFCSFEDMSMDSEFENYDEANINKTPLIYLRKLLFDTNNSIKDNSMEIKDILHDGIREKTLLNYISILPHIFRFLNDDTTYAKSFYKEFISQINKILIQNEHLNSRMNYEQMMKKCLARELAIAYEITLKKSKYKKYYMSFIEDFDIINYIWKTNYIDKNQVYFPKNVSVEEITYALSLKTNSIYEKKFITDIQKLFKKINYYTTSIKFKTKVQKEIVYFNKISSLVKNSDFVNIAIANLSFGKREIAEYISKQKTSILKTNELFKLVDYAAKQKANYLLLPEFSVSPFQAITIAKHAKKKNISIVSGLSPFINRKRIKNFIWVYNANMNLSIVREKNQYPLEEIQVYFDNGYYCKRPNKKYFVVNDKVISYGHMLCFEATSIRDRASHKDKIDVMFCPVLNRDTIYFSNILCSFSRDARIFIAQSNVNSYGDSRIIAPFKNNFSDIVKVKGGINNYVVVGKLDFKVINEYKKFEKEVDIVLNSTCKYSEKSKKINDLKIKYKINSIIDEKNILISKPKSAD